MGFLIDASGSVGLETFSREKNFVKLVSRRFAASSPDTRLGLIVFSDTPKLFVDFGDFGRMTIDQFQATVDQVPFQGGRSRIDLALRATSQDLFSNRRSGVPRVSENNKTSENTILGPSSQDLQPKYFLCIKACERMYNQSKIKGEHLAASRR